MNLTTNQKPMTMHPDPNRYYEQSLKEISSIDTNALRLAEFHEKYPDLFRRHATVAATPDGATVTFFDIEPVKTLGRDGWTQELDGLTATYTKVVDGVLVRLFRLRAVETPEPKVVSL